MNTTVFIQSNDRQMVGAIVSAHSLRRNARDPAAFDIRILRQEDFPFFADYEGRRFLRGGGWRTWRNADLQSFTPTRFMVPEVMQYTGRALVIDPDVFAVGDVNELLGRDMDGKAVLARRRAGHNGRADYIASSVMLLDCARLQHWNVRRQFAALFAGELDYEDWMVLAGEPRDSIGALAPEWNDFDRLTPATRLLHNTKRRTQPWKTGLPIDFTNRVPLIGRWLPDNGIKLPGRYRRHPDPRQEALFFGLLRECLEQGLLSQAQLEREMQANHLRHDALELMRRVPPPPPPPGHGTPGQLRAVPDERAPPRVWVLQGAHAGDNAQALHLAERLGLPFEVKPLRFNALHMVPFWLRGAGPGSVRATSRGLIGPPWPELVIAIGKRLAPVALHIRRASGGRSRVVQLGRPRAPLHLLDLVVTTPQYGLPRAPNVVELALPFARRKIPDERARAHWAAAWSALPRPLTAVLVGAGKWPQRFGLSETVALATCLAKAAQGGSVLLIGSPRSRPEVLDSLAGILGACASTYPYNRNVNPYRAALAIADRVVVTSDSMCMLGDAILSGKPVSIHQLPVSRFSLRWSAARGLMAMLARRGLLTPPRDMHGVAGRLIASGHADALGAETIRRLPPLPDYDVALGRIMALLQRAPHATAMRSAGRRSAPAGAGARRRQVGPNAAPFGNSASDQPASHPGI